MGKLLVTRGNRDTAEVSHIVLLYGGAASLVKRITFGHESSPEDLGTPRSIEVVNKVFFHDFALGGYKLRLDSQFSHHRL